MPIYAIKPFVLENSSNRNYRKNLIFLLSPFFNNGIFFILIGWAFYKFNPWRKRFDKILRMQIEAGLVEHYKFKTWERMRKEFLESDEERIEFTERPIASAMNMDDLQGVFYLSGLLLGTHIQHGKP